MSFPSPSGNLNTGAGLQEFRLLVRKNLAGGNATTADVVLYENGSVVSTLLSGVSVTSLTGQILAATWDASLLSGINGAQVEVAMQQASGGSTGSGANRRRIEVGAIEWNDDYSTSEAHSGTASLSGGGGLTVSATTQRLAAPSLAAGGGLTVLATTARAVAVQLAAGGQALIASATARFVQLLLAAGGAIVPTGSTQRATTSAVSGGGGLTVSATTQRQAAPSLAAGGGLTVLATTARAVAVQLAAGGQALIAGATARFVQLLLAAGGGLVIEGAVGVAAGPPAPTGTVWIRPTRAHVAKAHRQPQAHVVRAHQPSEAHVAVYRGSRARVF